MKRLRGSTILGYGMAWTGGVVMGYPLLWAALTSLKSQEELNRNLWGLPQAPQWSQWLEAWRAGGFRLAYGNSLLVATAAGLLALLLSAWAGYAFARSPSRWREPLFLLFLGGMMIPVHALLIPLYRWLGQLGWLDRPQALIASYTALALPASILIFRGFFETLPREVEEAAWLEGCSPLRLLWSIVLPMARPAVVTVALFNFVTMWNELVFALTFITSPERRTLPLALMEFSQEYGMNIPLVMAGLLLAVVPGLVFFLLGQRHIIAGLTAGAVQ